MEDFSLRGRNKSAPKLKGFGPIYCINLDGQEDRWKYMEDQFKYWELKDYTRISAYDGREDDLSGIIQGSYPTMMSSGEIGCTTSHLKAMKEFLKTDSLYAIMIEDDCDLDLVRFWNFSWVDFAAHVPYDWDVIQLAIICTGDLHVKLHKRFVNDFSTACYMISRHHAEKLVRLHCRGEKYKLHQGMKPRPVADDLIYNSGNTFAIPLFMYKVELGSSIHPEHVEVFHKSNHQALWGYWSQQGANMEIAEMMDYDPYLGRVTENTIAQQQAAQQPPQEQAQG